MAKLIKQIHDLIGLGIDKGYTQDITDSEIDDVVDSVQMTFFRQNLKEFPKNNRIRDYILPFQVRADITCTGGIGPLPTDFEHEIEAWTTVSTVKYPVSLKESGFFRRRVLDKVSPPTASAAIATIYNNAGATGATGKIFEIAPQTSPVTLMYFKRPPKPVYATTATGPSGAQQYIYDDAATTDVSWSPLVKDILVQKSLEMVGLNMRDGMVVRAGQQTEPREASL